MSINLIPNNGVGVITALSDIQDQLFLSNQWASAQWVIIDDLGYLVVTNSPAIVAFINSARFNYSSSTSFRINGGNPIVLDDYTINGNNITFNTPQRVPEDSPIVVNEINFDLYFSSDVGIDYDQEEIKLHGIEVDINLFTTKTTTIDSKFIDIASDGTFEIKNRSTTDSIDIVTHSTENPETWSFGADGTLTFPDSSVQTTAYTGALAFTSLQYLELTDTPLIVLPAVLGQSVSFSKSPNASNTDPIDTGLTLARGVNGGLFNIVSEQAYDNNLHISPVGTRWNADGWGDLSDVATRSYGSLRSVLNNAIGNNILAAELVMHDTINDKYYKFDFTSWTQNNAGGGFAYTRTLIENPNFFKKDDYATGNNAIDVFVADNGNGSGIAITRGVNQGIYNPFREEDWNSSVSPDGTLWNNDGWDDFSNLETRTYDTFDNTYGNGGLGNNVPGSKSVMYIPDTDEYYAIHWLSWTQNNAGGGFSYLRYEIDLDLLNEGITFADGSVLKSAEGLGSVKLRSPGRRRIEEAYGYNEVAVTAINTINLTTLASRNGVDENMFWIDSSNTTIDDIIADTGAAEILDETTIQFSLDNSTWYTFSGSISTVDNEKGYGVTLPEGQLLNYDAGDTIYFRYDAGGVPVEWWSKDDLPGGATNFRGAIIDYHAFTGDSTWIGTIHIVDDDGEEHITHTEVQSGSDDGENDDLWHVISEGRIHYRRIDGAAKLLKVQWSAKVFYGSEYWD